MSQQTPLRVEDLRVLQAAEELADTVWGIVRKWRPFERDTVGKQLVRAADSIGANIAEAYGRFHYGDKLRFLYCARGSVFETKYWLDRSQRRRLITAQEFDVLQSRIQNIVRQLNAFANILKQQHKCADNKTSEEARIIREPNPNYTVDAPDALFSPTDLQYLISNT